MRAPNPRARGRSDRTRIARRVRQPLPYSPSKKSFFSSLFFSFFSFFRSKIFLFFLCFSFLPPQPMLQGGAELERGERGPPADVHLLALEIAEDFARPREDAFRDARQTRHLHAVRAVGRAVRNLAQKDDLAVPFLRGHRAVLHVRLHE